MNVMQSTHTDVVQLIKCKFAYFLSFLRPLFLSLFSVVLKASGCLATSINVAAREDCIEYITV